MPSPIYPRHPIAALTQAEPLLVVAILARRTLSRRLVDPAWSILSLSSALVNPSFDLTSYFMRSPTNSRHIRILQSFNHL